MLLKRTGSYLIPKVTAMMTSLEWIAHETVETLAPYLELYHYGANKLTPVDEIHRKGKSKKFVQKSFD